MKPDEIIRTLIKEIDPRGDLGNDCNIGLAVFVSDEFHKLTLGDLRESMMPLCQSCDYWRQKPHSDWGQCVNHTYPGETEIDLVEMDLGGNQDAIDAIEERIFEVKATFGCIQWKVNPCTLPDKEGKPTNVPIRPIQEDSGTKR